MLVYFVHSRGVGVPPPLVVICRTLTLQNKLPGDVKIQGNPLATGRPELLPENLASAIDPSGLNLQPFGFQTAQLSRSPRFFPTTCAPLERRAGAHARVRDARACPRGAQCEHRFTVYSLPRHKSNALVS